MTMQAGAGTAIALADVSPDGTTFKPVVSAISANITTKFRESFESYTPGTRWAETLGTGDFVALDGNAAAASYLVISKDPLTAGTETTVETIQTFGMPFEAAIGLSMSQRTLGQEFAVEFVDTMTPLADVPDLEIASITQTTTTLTIDTVLDHGLSVGKSIGVRDCSNPIANYPSLVVASCPSPRQITCTAGPGGTIASQTIANPAGAKGWIYFRERLGRAQNGVSQIFENVTATNSSVYLRSESGDALPSGTIAGNHALTVGSTAPVQLVNSPFQYAFSPSTEFRYSVQADRVQISDVGVDQVAQALSRTLRTQVIPGSEHLYKLRFRFPNNKALTVPNAQILSATKSGTTTATIVTATPHGLALGDPVVIYGIRAQGATEFPNLLVATAVASVVDATTFTIVQGTAGTVTSYGGFVARVNGGNLGSALGYSAVVAQAAVLTTLTNGVRQLVLTGNTNWASLSIGDHVNLVGVRNATDGATVGVDGVWKVANVATTALTLVPGPGNTPPADFGSVNCGGGVIKRTEARISFVRVFDYERERVEIMARPAGDIAGAAPVAVQNVPAVTLTSTAVAGTVAQDAAIGNPVTVGLRASNANVTAMSAAGDSVAQLGTMIGVGIVKPYALPEAEWAFTGALTTTSDVQVQAAAGAGIKRHVTWVQATNTGGTPVDVLLRDATTTRLQFTVPAGQSVDFALPTGIPTTANAILNVALSAAGTVRFNALGYTAP